jgi:hypothetical protein
MDIEKLYPLLERIAVALERLSNDGKPAALNLVRPMDEFWNFDWSAIGAEIVKDDADGPTHVQHNGALYTRRSPTNKFDPAIWYSAPAGKDGDGNVEYVRLITFRDFKDADPLPGKVTNNGHKAPAQQQAQAPRPPAAQTQRPAAPPPTPAMPKLATRPYSPDVLRSKLAEWAKARTGQPCTAQHRTLLAGQLETAIGGKLERYEMSEWLFGSSSTADISCELVLAALKDWLEIKDWQSQPSESAIAEVKAAHAAAVAHIKATQKA